MHLKSFDICIIHDAIRTVTKQINKNNSMYSFFWSFHVLDGSYGNQLVAI